MAQRKLSGLAIAVGTAVGMLEGCSDHALSAPTTTRDDREQPGPWGRAAPGVHELSFLSSGQQVAALPVCTPVACPELALKATVQTLGGAPAQSGAVTFQYCSLRKFPPNDIERADEAPKEACESGEAAWQSLGTVKVGSGDIPPLAFGFVPVPRTVGFRFRYNSQGSSIASGVSLPMNFTWTSP